MSAYKITNYGLSTELLIYDEIGEWGITAKQVRQDLRDVTSPEINVRLNSPGGSVFDGYAIYNALREHPARVMVDIDSLAASIASVIALAGDTIRIAQNGLFMIHDPVTVTYGTADDHRRNAGLLDTVTQQIVQIYTAATGASDQQVREWMAAETWFDADQAVETGFASEVTGALQVAACVHDLTKFRNPPARLVQAAVEDDEKPPVIPWERLANERRRKIALTKLRN